MLDRSDVKRGQNIEADAEAIMKKYQIMINNIIRFKSIPGKINIIPDFARFLPEKCPIT